MLVQSGRYVAGWAFTLASAATLLVRAHVDDPRRAWLAVRTRWAQTLMKIVDVHLDVQGTFDGPCVIVCNHQSMLDVLAIPAVLPASCVIVGKKELLKIPVLGRSFFASGGIMIDRKDPEGAKRAMEKGLAEMPPGWSLMIFPEGTRSRDMKLLPFKKGFLYMARAARLPIVPVGIDGCNDAMIGNWFIRGGNVSVTIGEPIAIESLDALSVDDATQFVRDAVGEQVIKSHQRRVGCS